MATTWDQAREKPAPVVHWLNWSRMGRKRWVQEDIWRESLDATEPGDMIIRCLILHIVMPSVEGEPGKCGIQLSLWELNWQPTHQIFTESLSGAIPCTRWRVSQIIRTPLCLQGTDHWVAFTRKILFLFLFFFKCRTVFIYLIHFMNYFIASNQISFSWSALLAARTGALILLIFLLNTICVCPCF